MISLKARQERFRRWSVQLANAAARAVGGRRPAEIFGGPAWAKRDSLPWRFVYFCHGRNSFNINALRGIRVYFCVHGRKSDSRKIKGLA